MNFHRLDKPWSTLDKIIVAALIWGAMALAITSCDRRPAYAEQFQHTHDGDVGHFYQTWMIAPARTSSCCNEKDCYETTFKNEGGTWFYMHRETQTWKVVPNDKLEQNQQDPRESPNGRGHVCAGETGIVWCAVLGAEG